MLQLSFLFELFSLINSTSKFTWSIFWVQLSGNFDMFNSIFGCFQYISALKSIKYPREPLKELKQYPLSFIIQQGISGDELFANYRMCFSSLFSPLKYTLKLETTFLMYRTRPIITRGLYLFYPIFHCGLYLRAVYTAERLVITWIFFHLRSPKKLNRYY